MKFCGDSVSISGFVKNYRERQSYRWNKQDFEANAKEGVGIDWPIRYEDLESWYTHVEKFVGVSGQKEGLDVLPDGHFLPPMPLFAPEAYFKKVMFDKFNRPVTVGRVANLTQPQAIHTELGRASCQYRNKCARGCPYGGYYSSLSGAIPAAMRTKRLTMLHDSIVAEIIYDDKKIRPLAFGSSISITISSPTILPKLFS